MKEKVSAIINIKNKRASFEYHLLDKYKAGLVLTGTEIKSVRQSKVNFGDAYCHLSGGELWLKKMHISVYEAGTHYNHEPLRDRKLLLEKKELKKLEKAVKEKGQTIIPVRLFINDRGYAKMEIALAKGKKLYDKRHDIKEKDAKRETDRKLSDF